MVIFHNVSSPSDKNNYNFATNYVKLFLEYIGRVENKEKLHYNKKII